MLKKKLADAERSNANLEAELFEKLEKSTQESSDEISKSKSD